LNPDELKKVAEDLANTWESELKPRLEQMESEQKAAGEATTETKTALIACRTSLDAIEAKIEAANLANKATPDGSQSQECKDFMEWHRKGVLPEESKVLAIRDETLGGVLAPADFVAEVIKGIVQYSPIRDIAKKRQTSRTSVQYPKRTGNFAARVDG
jgi:HK97 family phage major capsid protein